jgi:hypothetical protein
MGDAIGVSAITVAVMRRVGVLVDAVVMATDGDVPDASPADIPARLITPYARVKSTPKMTAIIRQPPPRRHAYSTARIGHAKK